MKAHSYEPTKRAATPMTHQPSPRYFEEPQITWQNWYEIADNLAELTA